MNRNDHRTHAIFLICLAALTPGAFAEPLEAGPYRVEPHILDGAGAHLESASYSLISSTAQPGAVGKFSVGAYTLLSGFPGDGFNTAPVAVDDTFTIDEDTVLSGESVSSNDSDFDGDARTVVDPGSIVSDSGAPLTVNSDGTFTYDPRGLFNGLRSGAQETDTFTYTIADGEGGTDTAVATITITGANDAPEPSNDTYATTEDAPISIADFSAGLLGNDTDPDLGSLLLIISFDFSSDRGAVISVNPDGTFSYDATNASEIQALDTGDSLTDTFSYTVFDGFAEVTAIVTVTVSGENESPTVDFSISPPDPLQTQAGPVTFKITYVNATEITLSVGDITLDVDDGSSASGEIASVETGGTPEEHIVTVDTITGDGALFIVVAPGTATDIQANLAPENTSPSILVDNMPPTPIITTNGGSDFATFLDTVTLTGTVPLDAREMSVTLDSVDQNNLIFTQGAADWSIEITAGLGLHNLVVTAVDVVGNSASDTLSINVVEPTDAIYVRPDGDDVLNDGTANSPWRTIEFALHSVEEAALAAEGAPVTINLLAFETPYEEQVRLIPHTILAGAGPENTEIQPILEDMNGNIVVLAAAESKIQDLRINAPSRRIDETPSNNPTLLLISNVRTDVSGVEFDGKLQDTSSTGLRIQGAESNGSRIEGSRFFSMNRGIWSVDSRSTITENDFDNISDSAIFIGFNEKQGGEALTPIIGDRDQFSTTGFNRFRNISPIRGETAIRYANVSPAQTLAQFNDWGVYTREEIEAIIDVPDAAKGLGNIVAFDLFMPGPLGLTSVVALLSDADSNPIPESANPTVLLLDAGNVPVTEPPSFNPEGLYVWGPLPLGTYGVQARASGYDEDNNSSISNDSSSATRIIIQLTKSDIGGGETPDLCAVLDDIDSQFDMFTTDFAITDPDFDNDEIDDKFTLALLRAVCSRELEDDLQNATLNAFDINRMTLEAEAQFDSLQDYKLGLAALLLLSTDMQTAVRNALADQGITLSGTYEIVKDVSGVFMPSAVSGLSLAQGYEVFEQSLKAINEPYSATGDFDGDGATNLAEYTAFVIDGGGSVDDFLAAADDPLVIPEGEAPALCAVLDNIDSQFDMFTTDFAITDPDFDNDEIDDKFTLALLRAVCSRELEDELRNATLNAFDINRMNLEAETQFDTLQDYKLGLAALLLLSTDMQTAVSNALADQGITLSGTYEIVTGVGEVFMPSAVSGLRLAQGYEVFEGALKATNEPYSATGDFDEDGFTNLAEYNAVVIDEGGSVDDFVEAASDPQIIVDEGEVSTCGALWIDGTPTSQSVGDIALLILCVGAMLFHRRRRVPTRSVSACDFPKYRSK